MFLSIDYENFRDGESAAELYGDWWASNSYSFNHIEKSSSDGYKVMEVSFEPKVGDTLFFVWVSYSTGDSFGNETGVMCKIGVYDSRSKAEQVAELIRADARDKKSGYSTLVDPDGIPIYTGPWKGYFERLEEVRVEALRFIGEA